MDNQVLTIILFIASALLTISMTVIAWLISVYTKIDKRVDELEKQQAETNFKVTPLWARVQKTLSEDLHHPHAKDKEMDVLLEQLESLKISQSGTMRLKELLIQRMNDETISERERKSAEIMPFIMDLVLEEEKKGDEITNLELIGDKIGEKEEQ